RNFSGDGHAARNRQDARAARSRCRARNAIAWGDAMTTREELAAAGALGEVSPEEAAEMTALGMSQDEIYAMELAAAAGALAASEPRPAPLRDRLIGSAQAPPMRPPPSAPLAAVITMKKKVNPWAYVPWIAMAACLLIALVAIIRPWIGGARSPDKERKD